MTGNTPTTGPIGRAARQGDRAAILRALRDRIADALDETTSARDVAALANRLIDVTEVLAAVDAGPAGTPLDTLRRRRAGRVASGSEDLR